MYFPSRRSPEETNCYYEIRLDHFQREALIKLLEGGEIPESTASVILQRTKAAERYECLPFELNWSYWEEEAAKRGQSLSDYIWDKASGPLD